MNIGEKFYCSRCLEELEDDRRCPYCGYDPDAEIARENLEEGTLLCEGRYLVGSAIYKTDDFIFYGGYDLKKEQRIFLQEYFPEELVQRDTFYGDEVRIKQFKQEAFLKFRQRIREKYQAGGESFEENETIYLVREASYKIKRKEDSNV